jgi:hypothetical protein
MESVGCWNGCRLLGRHLETEYSLPPIQAGWAQQQLLDDGGSEAADGLLAELMKEAFGDTSIPTPVPTPSPSVLCTIVATEKGVLGVAALVGGGRYFAAQLQAAQAAGAVRADQYRIGVKLLALQLPAVAVDAVDWLARGLLFNSGAGTGTGAKNAEADAAAGGDAVELARITVLAEFALAAHDLGAGFELEPAASMAARAESGEGDEVGVPPQEEEEQSPQNRLAGLTYRVVRSLAASTLRRGEAALSEGRRSALQQTLFLTPPPSQPHSRPHDGRTCSRRRRGLRHRFGESGGGGDGGESEPGACGMAALKGTGLVTVGGAASMVEALRTCGVEWFVRAAVQQMREHSSLEPMLWIAQVSAVAVTSSARSIHRSGMANVFTEVLPQACLAIADTGGAAQGVALAALVVRVAAVMLDESKASAALEHQHPGGEGVVATGGEGGGARRKRRRTAAAVAVKVEDGEGSLPTHAAATTCVWPADELGALATLMTAVLRRPPTPALAFPVALLGQAQQQLGPEGLFPVRIVGGAFRGPRLALARALRLYGKADGAVTLFDLTDPDCANEASLFYQMSVVPPAMQRPLPFIPAATAAEREGGVGVGDR